MIVRHIVYRNGSETPVELQGASIIYATESSDSTGQVLSVWYGVEARKD